MQKTDQSQDSNADPPVLLRDTGSTTKDGRISAPSSSSRIRGGPRRPSSSNGFGNDSEGAMDLEIELRDRDTFPASRTTSNTTTRSYLTGGPSSEPISDSPSPSSSPRIPVPEPQPKRNSRIPDAIRKKAKRLSHTLPLLYVRYWMMRIGRLGRRRRASSFPASNISQSLHFASPPRSLTPSVTSKKNSLRSPPDVNAITIFPARFGGIISEVQELVKNTKIYHMLLKQVLDSCVAAAFAVSPQRVDQNTDRKASHDDLVLALDRESQNFVDCMDGFKKQLRSWASLDTVSTLCFRDAIRDSILMTRRLFCSFSRSTMNRDIHLEAVSIAVVEDEQTILQTVQDAFNDATLRERLRSLRGDEAKSILKLLQTIIDQATTPRKIQKKCEKWLVWFARRSKELPPDFFISGITMISQFPAAGGSVGDVYTANYGGERVAVKVLRRVPQWRHQDILLREVLLWRQLKHKHILPFLGVSRDFSPSLAWVSPWMRHGNVLSFLQAQPGTERLSLIIGVAKGLAYLHYEHHLVHGELRGNNVLIDANMQPRLSDFDLSFARVEEYSAGTTSVDGQSNLRWMAPEIIAPESQEEEGKTFRKTRASDTYAFACVCLEILTGRAPYYTVKNEAEVLIRVLNGEKPPHPPIGIDDTDDLWAIIDGCMARRARERPDMRDVVKTLRTVILSTKGLTFEESDNESTSNRSINSDTSLATNLINLETSIDDVTPFKVQVPNHTGQVEKLESHPRKYGGFSEIYLCRLKSQLVAWKILIPHYHTNAKDLRRQLLREVLAWHNLVHLHVAPFFGVAYDGDRPGMLGAWFENGNAPEYLEKNPNTDRMKLIQDVACGLTYLHSLDPPVVHGDLKGSNILVDDNGHAVLTDFGLSRVILAFGKSMVTTKAEKGSLRWQAPELLREWDNKEDRPLRVDRSSDVYSFASVALELLTGRIPYYDLKNDGAIIIAVVVKSQSPGRPAEADLLAKPAPSEEFWTIIQQCWDFDTAVRPSMVHVEESMKRELSPKSATTGSVSHGMHSAYPTSPTIQTHSNESGSILSSVQQSIFSSSPPARVVARPLSREQVIELFMAGPRAVTPLNRQASSDISVQPVNGVQTIPEENSATSPGRRRVNPYDSWSG
ncbi:kinase-like domain-containing protein [Mycena floridula]|nr:kinase-like domain-containing protein [Mycena floridula]